MVKLVLKNLLFTLVVPGTVGVFAPLLLSGGMSPKFGVPYFISLALFIMAIAIYLWGLSAFAFGGLGTPLPSDPPKRLVIQGPYRYTRNPMYFALSLSLLAWILLFQAIDLFLYALGVLILIYVFVTRYEEPHLCREFGADYELYTRRVSRWLPRPPGPWVT